LIVCIFCVQNRSKPLRWFGHGTWDPAGPSPDSGDTLAGCRWQWKWQWKWQQQRQQQQPRRYGAIPTTVSVISSTPRTTGGRASTAV